MSIDWKLPWRELCPDHRETLSLQEELDKEISKAHPIYGKEPRIVARRIDTDDVLVLLNNNKVAVVHLTYSGQVDQFPEEYPWTTIFENMETFVEECMKVDALGYEESV